MENKNLTLVLLALFDRGGLLPELTRYIQKYVPKDTSLILRIHEWMVKCCKNPTKLNQKLCKEQVFKKVYGSSTAYNDDNLRKLTSRYYDMVKDFLVLRSTQNDTFWYYIQLIAELEELGLDKPFYEILDKAEKCLPKEEVKHHLAKSNFLEAYYYHPKRSTREKKQYLGKLDEAYKHHEIYSILKKLKYFCEKLFWNKVYGEELPINFEAKLEHSLSNPYIEENLLARLFSLAARLLHSPSFKTYNEFKDLFLLDFNNIHSEKSALLTYLLNGLALFNYGDGRVEEIFSLHKLGLKHQLLVEKGVMEELQFINVVSIACNIKELDWCEDFIYNHLPYFNKFPKQRDNIEALSMALLNFEREEFKASEFLLRKISSPDQYFMLCTNILKFKVFYELGKHDDIYDAKHSFLSNLSKKVKIGHEYESPNVNFLLTLEQIINFENDEQITKTSILAKIESFNNKIVEREWLIAKIKALHDSNASPF